MGHISFYYDAGMFDLEINAGRYLAGDWGATTTISRVFGNGWEVGGATFTDVPFETFGEGSFDKGIYKNPNGLADGNSRYGPKTYNN